jgi:hypothetical protein
MVPGCVPFKIVSDNPTLHSRWLLFFKVMIIPLWNLLQYHSIVRWAIQAQWAEPLVVGCERVQVYTIQCTCIVWICYMWQVSWNTININLQINFNLCPFLDVIIKYIGQVYISWPISIMSLTPGRWYTY